MLRERGVKIRVLNINGEEWGYNPFFFVDPKDARKDIGIIVQSILPTSSSDDFWTEAARILLQGLLLYYYCRGYSFAQACMEILSNDLKQQTRYAMLQMRREVGPLLGNMESLNDKTFTSISSTLATALTVFTENELQRVMSKPQE